MIDASRLLADCQRLVRLLEDDLRERLREHPELDARVQAEFDRAKERQRTGQSYTVWRDEYLTQVAVHWVLAAVFVRFLEDNELLPEAWISGPGPRLGQARDRHERFFVREPAASDRDYLLGCFREVERLPAMAPLFDERHNPLFKLGPTADGARAIVELFRRPRPEGGGLLHDFSDPDWSTRFLGDLYQDLSEAARKRYALLQTPEFVEEFLLDRTLEPAIAEVGYQKVNLIDPACGSGHFLLGAFYRLFARWRKNDANTNEVGLAAKALDQIAGVDLNPFAVAIARFRLLVAALKVSGIRRLADAPAFPLHLAAGDSLLHGGPRPRHLTGQTRDLFGADEYAHYYSTEDEDELGRLLGRQYTVVVGNPPYITPKDPALNRLYRDRFGACHGKYSVAVPFTERFFDLANPGGQHSPAGWIAMITANSFMKREFGKKLIEQYIPRWDLMHVIDTSGAYLPGHGIPTVILIGRNRAPIAGTIRTVMGIRGEPAAPEDPAKGLVWSAIVAQTDSPGSRSEFISVSDIARERLQSHPWSLGGGGALELKEALEASGRVRMRDLSDSIGITSFTLEDDIYVLPKKAAARHGLTAEHVRQMIVGDAIRDWHLTPTDWVVFPYDSDFKPIQVSSAHPIYRYLWCARTSLSNNLLFGGKTKIEGGLLWYEFGRLTADKLRMLLSIAFAFVATHNHFVLDRGGKVFKQTAPVIKLPADTTEEDHLPLLGLLNSSTACFWMKQVFFDRGNGGIGGGIASEDWERFYEHDSTKLQQLPLPSERPRLLSCEINQLAQAQSAVSAQGILQTKTSDRHALNDAFRSSTKIERRLIALQEELDWQVYRLYGLLEEPLEADLSQVPEVSLGERPFEIVLARKMAAGEIETKWFERHGSTPITEIPAHWPEPYRQLVEKRIQAIEDDPSIALIEQPEFKRRWNREPWEEQEKRALRDWLLDRLEDRRYWPEPRVVSTARLADLVRQDQEFRQIAALYRGRDDFDWTELVTELAMDEAVPFLAPLRYTDSGQRKRAVWEETWRLQRLEDAGEKVETIPVPPRYASADFQRSSYWRLRGKLDVPKERFILYPGLERAGDPTPVISWAGWNHLEQAQALAVAFNDLREKEGWGADRLAPVLAGLLELIPWLLQWHNEPDPAHGGERLGNFFSAFLDEAARPLGLTRDTLAAWRPEEKTRVRRGGRKKKSEDPGLFLE